MLAAFLAMTSSSFQRFPRMRCRDLTDRFPP